MRKSIVITWLQARCSQGENRRAMLLWATPEDTYAQVRETLCVCVLWCFWGTVSFWCAGVCVCVRQEYQECYARTIFSLSAVKTFRNTSRPFPHHNNTSRYGYESFCVLSALPGYLPAFAALPVIATDGFYKAACCQPMFSENCSLVSALDLQVIAHASCL